MDNYWEEYKPTFAERKELFLKVSAIAQREALDFVMGRMQRNNQLSMTSLVIQSEPDGKFEFRKVPIGSYKIVGIGTADKLDVIWSETLEIRSPEPVLVKLKTHVP